MLGSGEAEHKANSKFFRETSKSKQIHQLEKLSEMKEIMESPICRFHRTTIHTSEVFASTTWRNSTNADNLTESFGQFGLWREEAYAQPLTFAKSVIPRTSGEWREDWLGGGVSLWWKWSKKLSHNPQAKKLVGRSVIMMGVEHEILAQGTTIGVQGG